jgi:TonB family protein
MLAIAALLGSAVAVAPPRSRVPVRPPVPPPTAAPAVHGSDADVWALATRSGTKEGYFVYLRRFPNGFHAAEAIDALRRLGDPMLTAPPAPPAPPATAVSAPRVPPPPPDPCIALLVDQETGNRDTPEGRAYLAARRSNRVSAYRACLAAMPKSVCAAAVQRRIDFRAEKSARMKAIAGFGPLPSKLLDPHTIEEDDYPPLALRKEQQGTVAVAWDVAEDGVVEDCRLVLSSGHVELDEGTCELVTARFRYDPARDAAGRVIRSTGRQTFRWQIAPDTQPVAPSPGS